MDCIFINLDASTQRRQGLESNFAACRSEGWRLVRFPAVNGRVAEAEGAQGRLSPAEKGCFLSHREIMKGQVADEAPVFIAEDDAWFGRGTCQLVDELVKAHEPDTWDLLFTDICVPNPQDMINLTQMRRQTTTDQKLVMLDLTGVAFAGSTAYVVNGRSKRKYLALLQEADSLDVPFDLYLRSLVHQGKLKAFVVFPFLTTLSEEGNRSLVDGGEIATVDIARNAFRRLMWFERDLQAVAGEIKSISDRFNDADALLLGHLLGTMTSPELHPK